MIANEECLQNFIEEYSIRLAQKTMYAYQKDIQLLLTHCDKSFADVTSRDIRSWMQVLESTHKSTSIRKMISGVRLFYKYCHEEEIITHNPVLSVSLPLEEDRLPHYLTYDQLSQLRLLSESNVKKRAIIEVLYTTGVRVSELTQMKLEDIQWSERIIRIPKGKGKKERIVLFTNDCAVHLQAYLQGRSDEHPFLFLNRYEKGAIDVRSIQNWLVSFREPMGIFLSPHILRHTFAAHLAMKGMPLIGIQSLLGHVKPEHTQLYARLFNQARKQMYDEWM